MNYYGPRKRAVDGRFDFTCQRDNLIYPVGYCRTYVDPEERIHALPYVVFRKEEIEKMRANKSKYHNDGHETKEEAIECYRSYQLDHETRLDGKWKDTWHRCQIEGCDEITNGYAQVASTVFDLCDKHRTIDVVESLFSGASEIMSSY